MSETETQIEIEVANANRTILTTRTIPKTDIKAMDRETLGQTTERLAYEGLTKYKLNPNQEFSTNYYAQGVSAYQGFLNSDPNSTFASVVRQRVADWQEESRQVQKGLVKFGNQWMTPAEKRPKQELKAAIDRVAEAKQRLTSLEAQRDHTTAALAAAQTRAEQSRRVRYDLDQRIAQTEYKLGSRFLDGSRVYQPTQQAAQDKVDRAKADQDARFYEGQVTKGGAELQTLDQKINTVRSEFESAQRDYENLSIVPATTRAVTGGSAADSVGVDCDMEIQRRLADSQDRYLKELASLAGSYQSEGDLEALLTVRGERQRFERFKTVDAKDLVNSPKVLRTLQDKHRRVFEGTIQDTVRVCVKALEETKRKLTIEGKLDEAIAVKMQIDAMKRKYGFSTEEPTAGRTH